MVKINYFINFSCDQSLASNALIDQLEERILEINQSKNALNQS